MPSYRNVPLRPEHPGMVSLYYVPARRISDGLRPQRTGV